MVGVLSAWTDRAGNMTMHEVEKLRPAGVPYASLILLASAAVVVIALALASDAVAGGRRGVSDWERGKARYCNYCHGPSGRGYLGYQPIPRLAGQVPEYLVTQLRLFAEQRRDRHASIAMARVHGVGDGMRRSLAAYYAGLHPQTVGYGPSSGVSMGRAIYEDGIPEANLPACAACHGSEGRGNAIAPRLAGQLYSYTVRQMLNWNRDRRQGSGDLDDPAVKMDIVARSMSRAQIEAVAAYLSRQN
jgi:cytochrome c553